MTHRLHRKNDEGVALVLSLIFLVAMAILIGGLASRTHSQGNQVMNYVEYDHTLQAIEAGFAMARAELNGDRGSGSANKDGLIGVDTSYNLANSHPWFDETGVTPAVFDSMSDIEYIAFTYEWGTDNIDNNGDGTVDEVEEEDFATVYSFARAPGVTRRAEMIMEGIGINIWRNAIFAGAGQTNGTLINGNVSIHGSVHLLGDNLADGDLAVAALDLSGTSLIHNNYAGVPADLEQRVPALPTTVFEGETISTLEASLRVKHGLVGVSGNSEIGEPQQTGNTFKETMDGIYITDGWTGNGLDGNGDPINVHSDNGHDESYDLGNAMQFPTYDDDGGRDHLAYYLETNVDPNVGFQQVFPGDIDIVANKNFYWNSTTGVLADNKAIGTNGMPAAADLDPNEFYIWFDATANRMMINGRIAVDGNISFDRGNGNDKSIDYTGKGSLLAYDADLSGDGGDVSVEVSMRTMNTDGTTANSFPVSNLLGMMAEKDMMLGVSSQLELMGGFYAQDEVIMNKQTTLMGTIVGESFNMGGQVPDIYQVPELADQWGPEMRVIGADDIRIYQPLSWRELGVL